MDVRIKLPDEMTELLRKWGKQHMPGYDENTTLEAILLRLHTVDAAWRERYPELGREVDVEVHKSFGWPDPE